MKEDFVTYEQAVKLKELGFDYRCNHYFNVGRIDNNGPANGGTYGYHNKYSTIISAPTLAQAQKWFREKGIIIIIGFSRYSNSVQSYYYDLKRIYNDRVTVGNTADTYEQALSAGIDKALELLKENK